MSACCCIEGNDMAITTCATNDCPEHGASEADRLLVALVDPQDEQLDTEGFCEHGLLSGVGCSEWEHKPWDAARAYIERKGLA